jgi:3'-5' exoribonuclease
MARLGELFPEELQPAAAPAQTAKPVLTPLNQAKPVLTPLTPQGKAAAPQPKAPVVVAKRERTNIADMASGKEFDQIFLVGEASLRVAKNGSKYIQAIFCDKTGQIPVRQWDCTENELAAYKNTGFVKARGRVETFKNASQIVVFAVQELDADGINAADFMPVSVRPLDEMEKEFDALLETLNDEDYKRLLKSIFAEPNVRQKFVRGPAATNLHHAWVGGLIEHVLSAAKTAEAIAAQRPFLNRDLLLAGTILHDIGKIEELDAGPGFPYTDTGRLCGHIVLGALLVERHVIKLGDIPSKKRDLLIHMILSHHGELEYGSPVLPMTGEAVALHHLECLDAKVQGIQTIIEKERTAGNDGTWSEFSRMVEGRIYKKAKDESAPPATN